MDSNRENEFMATNIELVSRFKSIDMRPAVGTQEKRDSRCHVICRRFFICILLVAVVILSAIIYGIYYLAKHEPDLCNTKECLRSAAVLKQNMNLEVDPCDDFYNYACGKWAEEHPRPQSHFSYNWYSERQVKIYSIIRARLESNISRSDPRPVRQAKAMYIGCQSATLRKEEGFKSLAKYLKEFGLPLLPTLLTRTLPKKSHSFDWVSSVAKIQRKLGLNVIVGFNIVPDHQDKSIKRLILEYPYAPEDFNFPSYEWSKKHSHRHKSKTSTEDSEEGEEEEEIDVEKMDEIMKALIEAVKPSMDTSEMDDRIRELSEQYLKFMKSMPKTPDFDEEEVPEYYTIQEIQKLTDSSLSEPLPIWQNYLDTLFKDLDTKPPTNKDHLQIDNGNVEFLANVTELLAKQPSTLIELYVWVEVTYFILNHDFSDHEQVDEDTCAKQVHKLMGLAVSYAIADPKFLTETKPRIDRMLDHIGTAFHEMILETDWMDAYTKYAALEKSRAMKALIGFPEWIMDIRKLEDHYRGLHINASRHVENWINAVEFLNRQWLESWRGNNDKVWDMDPTQVNAFYLSERNAINIPVAIIQYPFYYLGLEALNYGSIGEILGHEMTHGFDNSGIHYDKFGKYTKWWSDHTLKEYNKRAECLIDQYNKYYVPEAKGFIDGNLTLGENIADNGGLREAFRAYREYVKKNGPEPVLPGLEEFSHEQLFFLSFGNQNCASVWRFAGKQILEDEHSPNEFRVRGVLQNMKEFSDAFQCPEGSPMNPQKKCRIW